MASRASTPSEGEILEAKKSHSRSPSSSPVNRQSRRVLYSRSPSPTATIAQNRSRRSLSRSPYRNNRSHRDRGSKRRHEDDHYSRRDRDDPRRFRVRYEDKRDRVSHVSSERAFEDRRKGGSRDHRRSRSRSPSRLGASHGGERAEVQPDRQHLLPTAKAINKTKAVSDRDNRLPAAVKSSATDEANNNQVQHMTSLDQATQDGVVEVNPAEPFVDVATLREQKRQKWEAIRAKHRNQPADLLKQANDGNTDHSTANSGPTANASVAPARAASEASSAPGTPRSNSSRGSTPVAIDFSRDSDLVNGRAQEVADVKEEEPSAADYDAAMDMDEDKKRHDHRLQHGAVPSVPVITGNPTQTAPHAATTEKDKNDFDMFADDEEDDDMFAPGPAATKTLELEWVSGSKAVDVNTMDDWDDDQGYYRVVLGELLDGRYHVQSNLGKGMFSAVVRALDQETQKRVAIKLIRSNETMRKAATKEIGILEKLRQADPEDRKHVIRLERSFEHKGHLCMVFENLHENLREVLKKFGRDVGIELQAVRVYAQQMFKGLGLLRKCNILHADLKPDNILVNERRTLLKVCDLGSAADVSDSEITPYLVSRFYRAPEIILGMPLDYAIDTWSIGCTLFELFTGKILFTGRTNNQMLRMMMECRGRFSTKMLRKAEFAVLHFDEQGMFRSVERDRVTGKDIVRTLNFLKPSRDLKDRLIGTSRDPDLNSFLDLLDKCLTLNPERRITPTDALKHPFLARKL